MPTTRKLMSAALALAMAAVLPPAMAQPEQEEAIAQEAEILEIGDRAPGLSVEKWIKGEEITGFEKGRVYVVEFWATWCGPCIAMFPHLSHLQKEFKDDGVTIIGVNMEEWDSSQITAETLTMVEDFVKEQGDRMSYTVAFDGATGAMATTFFRAAQQQGIPCAFVVDKETNIAWLGHPMWLDDVLPHVATGKWDWKKDAARIEAGSTLLDGIFEKAGSGNGKAAMADWAKFETEYPGTAHQVSRWLLPVFFQAGEYAAAYKAANEMTDEAIASKDAQALNNVAWTIVDPMGDVENKDLALALKAALAADEFTEHKDPMIIDTLARVYFLKGDVDKAIALQEKAIGLADDPDFKASLTEALDEYKAKKGG